MVGFDLCATLVRCVCRGGRGTRCLGLRCEAGVFLVIPRASVGSH